MLTYTPPDPRQPAKTREQPWLLLLMAFAWLWPGVFSHDLWNPDEPELFTAVQALQHGSGALVADVLGQTDFSMPPVYLWIAEAFRLLLSPWAADAYSASRFANVLFAAIGLAGCGFAGFHFLGRHHGRSAVLIIIGCVGLLPVAHFLNSYIVEFASFGLILWGFARTYQRVFAASLLLGSGWALLSLSSGWVAALAMMLMASLLPLHKVWRFKRYYLSLGGALAVALPLMSVYPLLLAVNRPALFDTWLNAHVWGAFGGFTHVQTAFSLPYFLKNVLWFAFPAWPLAWFALSRTQIGANRWSVLAVWWLLLQTVLLSLTPLPSQDQMVSLLPPLALLGAAQLDGLRRGAAAFLNWFGIMAFGLIAAFLWLGFFAMNYGWPEKLAERSQYFSPFYEPHFSLIPILVAVLFTPLWLLAITRKKIRGRQAVTNWAAGVTLSWALLMTLFLPWLDAAKSYAPVMQQMQENVPAGLFARFSDGTECVSANADDRRARIAWSQYVAAPLEIGNAACRYRLVQQPLDTASPEGWVQIWQGARPRNKTEGLSLQQKNQSTENGLKRNAANQID